MSVPEDNDRRDDDSRPLKAQQNGFAQGRPIIKCVSESATLLVLHVLPPVPTLRPCYSPLMLGQILGANDSEVHADLHADGFVTHFDIGLAVQVPTQ